MIPTIFALRVVTTFIAVGMLLSFFFSPTPEAKWAKWQARGWAFMCAAVITFGMQFFIFEQFGLPIQHPARQVGIGVALGLMWPSFQCARASAMFRNGSSVEVVKGDQVMSIGAGCVLIVACNILAQAFG